MISETDLLAFAEDPLAFVAIGPDEERMITDRAVVMFSPGEHYWSTQVARVRFGGEGVRNGVEAIHDLMRARGRREAAWSIGPSATPADLVEELLGLGFESESAEGSAILVLTEAPRTALSAFEVRPVSTFEEHVASIDVTNEAFAHPDSDAADDRRRARASFDAERSGGHTARLVAFDGARAVATGRAWFTPLGIHLGGGATIPTHRRQGAMSDLVAAAWTEAVRRDKPALVAFGGAMAAPILEQIGFRSVGRLRHLVDRFDRSTTHDGRSTL